jgi:hypothetical protein
MTKRWGVALKKNVVLAPGENFHSSRAIADGYTTFRKFKTRAEARDFRVAREFASPMRKTEPTVIIDLSSGTVVR